MSTTVTIELPEALIRQIKGQGISQQQLQTIVIRMIQRYLRDHPSVEAEDGVSSGDHTKTLRDLRGSIPVSRPQNFNDVRQQVIQTRIRKRMPHGT
jgi:hypothetical protein